MCKNFSFLLLQLFLPIINQNLFLAIGNSFQDRSKYATCGNLNKGCFFEITNNYPISPIIPTSVPVKAMLGPYRYIYLIFYIPHIQTQKTFYLEAYDTSTKETIITNGDCYFINTLDNNEYEIRIFKELNKNSFVQFRFLGLSDDFNMTVKIRFEMSHDLYFNDIALKDDNSLIKSEQESLKGYIEEMNQQYISLRSRQMKTEEYIERIMKKMFDIPTKIDIESDQLIYSETMFIPPCMTVTITAAFGLEISNETFFKSEGIELSKTKIINGKIDLHSDGIDLLGGKIYIDNQEIQILELYNKQIEDLIMEFGIINESYLVIVGTNKSYDFLSITIRYFDDINLETIYSEIQILIEIDNKMLKEAIKNKAANTILVTTDNKKVSTAIAYGLIIFEMIFASNGGATHGLKTVPLIP